MNSQNLSATLLCVEGNNMEQGRYQRHAKRYYVRIQHTSDFYGGASVWTRKAHAKQYDTVSEAERVRNFLYRRFDSDVFQPRSDATADMTGAPVLEIVSFTRR